MNEQQELADALFSQVAQKTIDIHITERLPLSQAETAHRLL